jgi:Trk-type K+ transport system membrane component
VLLICVVEEYDPGVSAGAVGACLFNSGLPINFLTTNTESYANMNTYVRIILMIDMLIGRLEVVPVFMVCSSIFWTRR